MAAAKGKTNWFAIWISVAAVVVVVAVGALVVFMNNVASGPGEVPEASNVDQSSGAISFGTGTDTVDTYIDFMCPYCNQFEQTEGDEIQKLVASGDVTLNVYPVSILDRLSQGTEYSSRAASAMYSVAVADPANSYAFLQALYANQPAENSAGLTDEQIVQIARDAGVDVTPELEESITSHEYLQFAKSRELPEGSTGTPTLVVNGTIVPVTYDPQADIVDRLS
ncbi:thioredoxin domain-containing protein [Microbacterium sp. cx-59]|uniref:DsbA family protein n=1 Tax=Microbacterium sp. cx-59 TaxID=2891207 RepID=UPI001E59D588|nr:thioredoxin domain-containing protein [Microbacterium sp. cx-59]MCC4908207.1 thioredoxin domain-containing protein [Microbacterium sp. cx-59]